MLALNLALRNIKLLDAESFLVLKERLGNFLDCTLNWVAFKNENLQVPVASEALADALSSSLVDIAVAQVKVLKGLVAIQEILNHLEHLKIVCNIIFRNVELSDLVVGLKTNHKFVETFSGDLIAMNKQLLEPHLLIFKHLREIFH
jgi:hypothetical protein